MADKYLRRLMRSGLFFFTSTGAHQARAAAPHKLKVKPHVQGLSTYKWNSIQGVAPVRSVRACSQYSYLPLQGISHCRPSSSATHHSFAEEGKHISVHDQAEQEEKQLARSYSCSKLQGNQQLGPSFKTLMHRATCHSHLQENRHNQSCRLHDFAAESSSSPTTLSGQYTRSWSAPRLLPQKARGFSSSEGGSSKGKRAPKGHVAVYVEEGRERHVVPIAYLSHPHFRVLLKRAESEFGFRQQGPGLRIPCSLSELHHTLHHISTH